VLFVIYTMSGFGISNSATTSKLTGGVFSFSNSLYLHLNLAVPVLILLMIHVLIGLKTALKRWGVEEERLVNAVLIALGVLATALIFLLRYLVS